MISATTRKPRKSQWDNDTFRERKFRTRPSPQPESISSKNLTGKPFTKKRPKRRVISRMTTDVLHTTLTYKPRLNTQYNTQYNAPTQHEIGTCDQTEHENESLHGSWDDFSESTGGTKSWADSMTQILPSKLSELKPKEECDTNFGSRSNTILSQRKTEDEEWNDKGLPNPHHLGLEHPWTLYFDVDWRRRHTIATMKNVADLWGVINNIPIPTKSPTKCNWSLFKDNIQPEWEDEHNKNGGKWNMDLGTNRELSDKIWFNLLLGVAGGTIDYKNEINGITLHLRPGGIRCALWTAGTDMKTQQTIGEALRKICEIPHHIKLHYKLQSEAIEKNSSYETKVTLVM